MMTNRQCIKKDETNW